MLVEVGPIAGGEFIGDGKSRVINMNGFFLLDGLSSSAHSLIEAGFSRCSRSRKELKERPVSTMSSINRISRPSISVF
jgi:hypothetical protein